MQLTGLDQIFSMLENKPSRQLIAVWAVDEHTIEAVSEAVKRGFLEATLVGDEKIIRATLTNKGIDDKGIRIVHESNDGDAAARGVQLINEGHGNLIMKGNLSTDKYMRAILDKERGLMNRGAVLSHVTVMKARSYHKPLVLGDVAIIPAPDLKQKVAIAGYLIMVAKALGVERPKLSVLAATEQVLPGMPACSDAAIISKMAERGQLPDAIVDGPLSLDLTLSKEAVRIKGIRSSVAGDADCVLFPNIEAGNVFYKMNSMSGDSQQAAILVGARVPAVLSSRGDSAATKLYSIALAAMLAD